MGIFDKLLGSQAPVHVAEVYRPQHDGRFHLLEARRGRGKSYGMTYWGLMWLEDMLPAILNGTAPHSRWNANFLVDHHRLALLLCMRGRMSSFPDALDLVHERVRYVTDWEPFFTSYKSLNTLDEANRSLDAYQTKRSPLLALAHDFHQQTRKHANMQLYGTQYVDWINTQTRKLFDLLWRVKVVRHKAKRGPDGLRVPLRFNYYGSDPYANGVDATVVRRADFKMTIPFDLQVARAYGSWEPIVTFPGDVEPRWSSFAELAAWMLENGIKPAPAVRPPDRLALEQLWDTGNWPEGRVDRDADAGLVPVAAGVASRPESLRLVL